MSPGDEGRESILLMLNQASVRCEKRGIPACSRFFPAEDRDLALSCARRLSLEVDLSGGWNDADRVQACFFPPGEIPAFTGVWMEIQWNARFDSPAHRDLLGSLMGLGTDRSYYGDLLMYPDHACLYTLPEMAGRLPLEWTQAGHVPLAVSPLSHPWVDPPDSGREKHVTVPSLRLDAVLSEGLGESRGKMSEMIAAGLVRVNHHAELRPDRILKVSDLISIHGHGRVRILSLSDPNRRGRIPLELKLYLHR